MESVVIVLGLREFGQSGWSSGYLRTCCVGEVEVVHEGRGPHSLTRCYWGPAGVTVDFSSMQFSGQGQVCVIEGRCWST